MTSYIFVSGVCAISDERIKAYFSKYGSRVTGYVVQRKSMTQPCCYSLIKFGSEHTANAVLRHRPHQIGGYQFFVKRILGIDKKTTSEHYFPVTELSIHANEKSSHDIKKIENYFKIFGTIQYVKLNPTTDDILVKYVDYDSVDQFFGCDPPAQREFTIQKVFSNDNQTPSCYPRTCCAHAISIALPIQAQVVAASTNSAQAKPQIVSKSSNITLQKTQENKEAKVSEKSQVVATIKNAEPVKSKSRSKKSNVPSEKANEVLNKAQVVITSAEPAPAKTKLVSKTPSVPPEKEIKIKKTEESSKVQMTLIATATNEPVKTNVILIGENPSASSDQNRSDYEAKLEKTIEELKTCQTSLREKEYEYLRIQEDYDLLKCKNEELKRLLDQERATKAKCENCQDNESLIIRLQLSLDHLEDKQKYIESLYADSLIKQKEQFRIIEEEHRSTMFRQKSISNRLVQYERCKQEVCDSNSGSRRLSFPFHMCGVVPQQPLINRSTPNRLHIRED